ncbi:hypothetical protein SLEP1_g15816 [Rubroshorea leprosula]|uniref:Uncharacterized protein n=1 Tax=Rubroshorea leprosula TaxID=152421 RepID=A0AAV5IWD7_9ROSI|nr:hypothetical protein SLEP1_g15816 [Rubroshorea leprosula]
MAVARCNATLMAVLLAVFALVGLAQAADAPAPSMTSGSGAISPSFTSAIPGIAVVLLFGFVLPI